MVLGAFVLLCCVVFWRQLVCVVALLFVSLNVQLFVRLFSFFFVSFLRCYSYLSDRIDGIHQFCNKIIHFFHIVVLFYVLTTPHHTIHLIRIAFVYCSVKQKKFSKRLRFSNEEIAKSVSKKFNGRHQTVGIILLLCDTKQNTHRTKNIVCRKIVFWFFFIILFLLLFFFPFLEKFFISSNRFIIQNALVAQMNQLQIFRLL